MTSKICGPALSPNVVQLFQSVLGWVVRDDKVSAADKIDLAHAVFYGENAEEFKALAMIANGDMREPITRQDHFFEKKIEEQLYSVFTTAQDTISNLLDNQNTRDFKMLETLFTDLTTFSSSLNSRLANQHLQRIKRQVELKTITLECNFLIASEAKEYDKALKFVAVAQGLSVINLQRFGIHINDSINQILIQAPNIPRMTNEIPTRDNTFPFQAAATSSSDNLHKLQSTYGYQHELMRMSNWNDGSPISPDYFFNAIQNEGASQEVDENYLALSDLVFRSDSPNID